MQVIGGIVGAVIGNAIPVVGWKIGYTIGSSLAGMLAGDTEIQGNKIGDIANQTSREGVPYPIVFGVVRPIGGVIIASGAPVIVESTESQGKGGGTSVTRESVFRTYAIGVCEGPITGYRRIWENGNLVYDSRPDSTWGAENNDAWLERGRLFYGTFDQLPSPDLESEFGVGTTPAHRGLAYIVVANHDLTGSNGAIPQYTFEVVGAEGVFVTSRPYAVEVIEQTADTFNVPTEAPPMAFINSIDDSGVSIFAGELRELLQSYSIPIESLDDSGATIASGELRSILRAYSIPVESINESGASITAGILDTILIRYENWPAESVDDSGASILSGSLT